MMDSAPTPKILVAGGVNVDTTFRLKAFPRIGDTVHSSDASVAIGGKGLNQALAVQRSGTQAAIVGAVGDDAESELIGSFLEREGISSFLQKLPGMSTGQAIIYVDDNADNMIVVNAGANAQVNSRGGAETFSALPDLEAVIANGETSEDLIDDLFKQAKAAGVTSVLNPSPMLGNISAILAQTDLLIVNENEAREISQSSGTITELIDDLAAMGPTEIVITLGAEGSCISHLGQQNQVPAVRVQAVDPTAAGDTFLGYYVAARCSGSLPRAAATIAAQAAAECVQVMGAADSIPRLGST